MKINKLISAFSALTLGGPAYAQFGFQDFNFEQAHPVSAQDPFHPDAITTASGLPFWTVTLGGIPQTQIPENAASGGAPSIVLLGPGRDPGFAPIDGRYSVLLQGSFPPVTVSISQNELIPSATKSLFFEANPGSGALNVLIGSQVIPFSVVGGGPGYNLYAADISAWAGQTQQLTFSALQDQMALNNWTLDDISFSTTAVPEPNALILTSAAGLLFAAYRRYLKRP